MNCQKKTWQHCSLKCRISQHMFCATPVLWPVGNHNARRWVKTEFIWLMLTARNFHANYDPAVNPRARPAKFLPTGDRPLFLFGWMLRTELVGARCNVGCLPCRHRWASCGWLNYSPLVTAPSDGPVCYSRREKRYAVGQVAGVGVVCDACGFVIIVYTLPVLSSQTPRNGVRVLRHARGVDIWN